MAELFNWDVAADNNNDAPPNGFPEGMAPSAVNNAAREVMAVLARAYQAFGGFPTTNGTNNNYSLTINQTITAYPDGMAFGFRADRSSDDSGDGTLNINAVGAVSLTHADGRAIGELDIVAGAPYIAVYDGTQFRLVGVNFGTVAGSAIRLDADARMPTVDSRNLQNLNANQLDRGIIPNARYSATSNARGVRTVSTSAPSGGADGDVWYQYET